MQEEIFGPVLPVLTFNKFYEVVQQINKLDKPLVVYYFGNEKSANFKRLEAETSSGALVANETLYHALSLYLPFGGVGYSGYGRYHGYEGFKAFSNMKSILVKSPLNHYPYSKMYPPNTEEKIKSNKRMIKMSSSMSQAGVVKLMVLFVLLLLLIAGLSVGYVEISKQSFVKVWDGLTLLFNALKAVFGIGNMTC